MFLAMNMLDWYWIERVLWNHSFPAQFVIGNSP